MFRQCSATTNKGVPCPLDGNRTRGGVRFCHVHDPQGTYQSQQRSRRERKPMRVDDVQRMAAKLMTIDPESDELSRYLGQFSKSDLARVLRHVEDVFKALSIEVA